MKTRKKLSKGFALILCTILLLSQTLMYSSAEYYPVVSGISKIGTGQGYSAYWQYWCQGASTNGNMRAYGCRVVSQAKLLVEAGIASSDVSIFNPDIFFNWAVDTGNFNSGCGEIGTHGSPAVNYAASHGGSLTYHGRVSLTGNNSTDAATAMNYINQGYYVIIGCTNHETYVGRAASLAAGKAVILDSYSSSSQNPYSTYTMDYNPNNLVYSYLLYFSAGSTPNTNPTNTVTVTFLEPDADAATHCYIYDTEACVARRVTNSAGATMDGVGVNMYSYDLNEYLGSASDSSLKNNKNAWYTSYEVTGKALTKGTRYCYQFFVILYGNTYYDEIKEFTTTGSYTVTFNANGGSCTASSIAAKCGYNYGAFGTIPSASRSGYTFDGWYTAANGGTQITSATLYTRTADQTLYAHWTPIPHVHSYTAVVTVPTCTDGGFTTYSCACGDVYTADSVDPLGHSFGAWTVTKEATVEEEGVETRYCANCQAAETRSIPKPVPTDVPTFALSDKTVTAGTQFDVTLSVINNPGIVTASVGVTYDPAILKLVSVTDGGLLGAGTAFPGKDLTALPYTMMWEDSLANANHTEDGVLATLTFEVLEDVPLGKTPITLSYIKNSTLNVDLDEVAFTLGNGSVEVTDRTPGDANDDGIVDLKDIVLLRRYLCGGWNVTVNLANTDVNADGAVDLKDVAILRRYLAGGWNVELK